MSEVVPNWKSRLVWRTVTFLPALQPGQVPVSLVGGVVMLAVLVGGAACERAPTPASYVPADPKLAEEAPVRPRSEGTERQPDPPGEEQSVEPKPEVKLGLATITQGQNADGASVSLVSGVERRPLPRLPITVQIPIDNDYSIVASKPEFADFEVSLEFEAGQTERTFVIDLVPVGKSADTQPPRAP